MPNDPRNDRFTPETIDEQIAQLKQGSPPDAADARLVEDLERTYREEQEEEQAIERIHARLIAKMQPTGEQQVRQLSGKLPQRKRIDHMDTLEKRRGKRQWMQKWSVLAAAVVVAVVVGSLITVLQLTHKSQLGGGIPMGASEQPTTTAKKAFPTDSGIYLGLFNQLVKVDKQTHKVLWRFVIKSDPKDRPMFQQPQVHDTPIVADGMVYFTAQTSRVYAVDAQTGKLRWARDFHAQLWPLKMANDVLYANPEWGEPGGNIDVSIYALDPANGATKTTYKETGQQVAGIFNGIMYLIGGGTVTAVKTSNGQQIWQTPVDAKELRINANVYLKNSTLYASLASVSENTTNTTQESYILTLDAQSGRITWRSPKINGSILDIAVGDDGRIYCGTQNHYVYAFDPRLKSLKELWKYRTIGPIYPAPIVQDGIVYVGQSSADEQNGNDDHLVALAAASGQQIWATPLKGYTKGGDTEPLVLHNGVIYLGTAGGLQGFATDSGKQVMLIPSDLLVSKKDVGNSGLFGGIAITIVD